MSALIIGCGYLGKRVAKALIAKGRKVYALTRSRVDELKAMGIEPIIGDVTDISSLNLPKVDLVVYAVGLDRRANKSMHEVYVTGLQNVLAKLPTPQCLVYVSSTSIYGQTDGSWVDESAEIKPIEESGVIVKEAESVLHQHCPFATILRFTGIYGPDRLLRKAALLKGEPLIGDAEKFINLIHVWDGARAILDVELAGEKTAGKIFNISDDQPVRRRQFYTYLAELLKAPEAAFEPGQSNRGDTNRQISNMKAKSTFGFTLKYGNFQSGLVASVAGIEE